MARPKRDMSKPPVEELPPDPLAEDTIEGETLHDWMDRKDEEEGRKHDANESRHEEPNWLEHWDPHLGVN